LFQWTFQFAGRQNGKGRPNKYTLSSAVMGIHDIAHSINN